MAINFIDVLRWAVDRAQLEEALILVSDVPGAITNLVINEETNEITWDVYSIAGVKTSNSYTLEGSGATEEEITEIKEKIAALENAEPSGGGTPYDDTELSQRIDNEATARTNADTVLDNKITTNTEKNTQQDGKISALENAEPSGGGTPYDDTELSQRIDNEATARTNADTVLDNKITTNTEKNTQQDGKISALENAEPSGGGTPYDDSAITRRVVSLEGFDHLFGTKLTEAQNQIETLERDVGELPTHDNLNDDIERAKQALTTQIHVLRVSLTTIEVRVSILENESGSSSGGGSEDLQDEITNLEIQITDLRTQISQLATRDSLNDDIANEANNRTNADNSLDVKITANTAKNAAQDIAIDLLKNNSSLIRINNNDSLNEIAKEGAYIRPYRTFNGAGCPLSQECIGYFLLYVSGYDGVVGSYDGWSSQIYTSLVTGETYRRGGAGANGNGADDGSDITRPTTFVNTFWEKINDGTTVLDVKVASLEEKTSPISHLPSTPVNTDDNVRIALAGENDIVLTDEAFSRIVAPSGGRQTGKLVAKFGTDLSPSDYVFTTVNAEGAESILVYGSDLLKLEQAQTDSLSLIKSYGSGDTNILVNIDANVYVKVQKLDHNSKANFLLDTKPKAQVNALIQAKIDEIPESTIPSSSGGSALSGDNILKLDQHQLVFVPKPTPFETRGFKQDVTNKTTVGNYTQADSFTAVVDGKIDFLIDSNEASTHADFTINDGTSDIAHTAVASFSSGSTTYFVYEFTGVTGKTYTASFNGGSRHLKSNLDIEKNKTDILSLKNEQRESTPQVAKDFHKSITESTKLINSQTEDVRVDKTKSFAALDNVVADDGTKEFQRSNIYMDKGSESALTNAILETQVDQQGFTSVPLEINGLSSNSLAIGFLMKMRDSSGQDVSLIKKSGRDILILKGDGVYARNYQLERLANTSTMEHTPLRFDNNTRYTYTAPQFDVGVTDIHVALPADLVGNPNAVVSNIVLNIHRSETADGLVVNADNEVLSIPLNADLSPTVAIPEFVEGNYGSESTRVLFSHKSSDTGKDIAIQVQLPFNSDSVAIDSLRITATLDYQVARTEAVAESTTDIPLISTEDLIVDVRLTANQETSFACELYEDASNGLQIRTRINNIPSYVRFANWTRSKISNTSVVIAKGSRVSVSILTILSFKIGTTRVFETESLPKKIERYGLGLLAFFKATSNNFDIGENTLSFSLIKGTIGSDTNDEGSITNTKFNSSYENSTRKPVRFSSNGISIPEDWSYNSSNGLITLPKGFYLISTTISGIPPAGTTTYENEYLIRIEIQDNKENTYHGTQFVMKSASTKQSATGFFPCNGVDKLLISVVLKTNSRVGVLSITKGHIDIIKLGNM